MHTLVTTSLWPSSTAMISKLLASHMRTVLPDVSGKHVTSVATHSQVDTVMCKCCMDLFEASDVLKKFRARRIFMLCRIHMHREALSWRVSLQMLQRCNPSCKQLSVHASAQVCHPTYFKNCRPCCKPGPIIAVAHTGEHPMQYHPPVLPFLHHLCPLTPTRPPRTCLQTLLLAGFHHRCSTRW